MKLNKIDRSVFFLFFIFFVVLITGIILIFAMRTDPLQKSLSEDNILKVLIVVEKDNVPISTHILAYYSASNRAAMFDIPGETGLIIKSLGRVDRIDAVYVEKGIVEYKKEIESITGIKIPFAMEISLANFARLTDLLGGLDVFIALPVDIVVDGTRVLLPSGAVSLDGDKITQYISYKDELDQDEEIGSRKQRAVLALFKKLNDQSAMVFSKEVFPVVESCIKTALPSKSLKSMLMELSKIDSERLIPQRVTGSLREVDGQTLLFPFYDGQLLKDVIKQMLGGLASDVISAQERVYVLEILNGTKKQGLAGKTSELYAGFGYDIVGVNNADTSDYDQTVIIDRIGNENAAKSIGDIIQCSNIQTASIELMQNFDDSEELVDFTIILGKDFDGRYVR